MEATTKQMDAGFIAAQNEALLKELEKYKSLIKASNIGAWEYFPETGHMVCNDIFFSMLGRDINDYGPSGTKNINTAWVDLLHPEDKQGATDRFDDYLKYPEGMYESYFRLSHSDGSWVWIWSRGRMLQNENAHPTITGTHVNITKRKASEELIQQERILLRTLIDSLPDIIYVKDNEGRKIISNRADVKSLGAKSEAEVIGKTDIELFPNDIGLRGYQDDMSVLRDGVSILNKEEFFLDEDGAKRWLVTSKIPVSDESNSSWASFWAMTSQDQSGNNQNL